LIRKALLSKLIRTERQAAQLRAWLANQESNTARNPDPDLARMLDWAREQLASLDSVLDPAEAIDLARGVLNRHKVEDSLAVGHHGEADVLCRSPVP
jgi:DNA-binding IclR family transcriptional regulator